MPPVSDLKLDLIWFQGSLPAAAGNRDSAVVWPPDKHKQLAEQSNQSSAKEITPSPGGMMKPEAQKNSTAGMARP